MKKIIRITTVPQSLKILLKGQLRFMSEHFEMVAVSSDGICFEEMLQEQNCRGVKINMTRKITPFKDFVSLIRLICLFLREKPDIVHTHTPKAGTLGMIAALICRVPIRMHTVAGLPLLVAKENKRRLLNLVEKVTYACATNVYSLSYEIEKVIIDNKFCNPKKIKINLSCSGEITNEKYNCK